MESKRKANGHTAQVEELDDRAAKRRKIPEIDLDVSETPETTTQHGLPFLEHIKKTTDKGGRLVATNFLALPSKKELPDYYEIIKMPISINTIEEKLKRREFPTLTTLESYCKRMISNAKEYNERGSEIHDDAERIRKAVSNYMTKINPAYKKSNYVPFPTPLPAEPLPKADQDADGDEDEDAEGSDEDADGEIDTEAPNPAPVAKRRPGRPPKNPSLNNAANGGRSSATPMSITDSQYNNVGFQSLTFQQAQEKIVADILRYKEDEDDEFPAFEPFVSLPPRTLKDYYQVIVHPVSLKGLQKRVRGIHGRNGSTGVSDFKSWKDFEEEAEHIWLNAWHYNEDGSEISLLAKDLEILFNKKLAQAKKHVAEPAQPKLKLKMSVAEPTPRITLRMGGKPSPADSPVPTPDPNGSTSSDQNGGAAPRRNPFGSSKSANAVPSLEQLDKARSFSGSIASPSPSAAALVKNEDGAKNSPSLPLAVPSYNQTSTNGLSRPTSSAQTNGTSMLPPTSTTPGFPAGLNPSSSGLGQPYTSQPLYHAPNPSFESKWRQPGKNASDAMITNLSLATHPGLNLSRHFRMDLPPSDTMTQQSITINLPASHYYLQIKPTIAPALLDRQHKLFVTSGTSRLHAMPAIPGHNVDPRHPLFEARLLPGVNRIEIELVAALPKGAPKPASGSEFELEKITVFANLLRN